MNDVFILILNFGILPKFSRKTSHSILPKFLRKTSHMKLYLAQIYSSHLTLFDFASLHFAIFLFSQSKNFKTREYTSVGLPGTCKNLLLIENVIVSKVFKSKTQSIRLTL